MKKSSVNPSDPGDLLDWNVKWVALFFSYNGCSTNQAFIEGESVTEKVIGGFPHLQGSSLKKSQKYQTLLSSSCAFLAQDIIALPS